MTGGNGDNLSLILVAAAVFLAGGLCAASSATDTGERHPALVRGGVWSLGVFAGLISLAALVLSALRVAAGAGVVENLIAAAVGLIFAVSAVAWLGFFGMWAALGRRVRAARFW